MDEVDVSFCATNLNTSTTLVGSLASIERIGADIGRPFEVIVGDGPSDPDVRASLVRWASSGPHRRVVRHLARSRGYGRRVAFEASTGSRIVPFDTSIVYGPEYGALLKHFFELETDRMLFSEICALSRRSILSVGGWRNLIGAEDVDVYAPVAAKFGLLAYPTGNPASQSKVMGAYAREMRYSHGGILRRLYRMFLIQRDKVIGANYRVSDLMAFNAAKPLGVRFGVRGWFTMALLAAAFSPTPRRRVGPSNNYLYFRNQMIESLLREDFREVGWKEGPPPLLPLTLDEMGYLDRTSEPWRRAQRQAPALFVQKQ